MTLRLDIWSAAIYGIEFTWNRNKHWEYWQDLQQATLIGDGTVVGIAPMRSVL
jgi:hypothetical protein